MIKDITSPRLLYLKGLLFLLTGVFASVLLLVESPTLLTAFLLAVAAWSFCRVYYFAFYVIEHYIDPRYRFAGLTDFARYVLRRRRGTMPGDALTGEILMAVQIQDEKAVAALAAATGPVELQAPDGRVLGRFEPVQPSKKVSYPELGITDEEFEARVNDRSVRWYTPDEVMARLRSLQKSE
ncbi:MAG: hypothetical protein J2P46_12210 [Zavarzinella sp.]|nr:hypothetical protein [Zavarzinella sp.]